MDLSTAAPAPSAVQPPSGSFAEHLAAESAAPSPAVAPAPPSEPVAADPPELEADSIKPDAELTEAARTLRKSRADERKAKIQREIDEAVRLRQETRAAIEHERAELDRLRQERERVARPAVPHGPSTGLDPRDPKPSEEDFQNYTDFIDARAAWAAREEQRRTFLATRERATRDHAAQQAQHAASQLDAAAEPMRERYSDFDAVIEGFVGTLAGTPRGNDVGHILAQSEVGGEIAYKIAKTPELAKKIQTVPNRLSLARELALVERDILAAKSAAKPITTAPAPPRTTVGAGASATAGVATGNSTLDHIRREEAEIAERRTRGLRY